MRKIKKRISVLIIKLRRDIEKGLDYEDCEHYLDKLDEIKDELSSTGEHDWVGDLDDIEIEEDEDDEEEYKDTAKNILEQFQDIQQQLRDEEPEKVVEKPVPSSEKHYHITKNDSHDHYTHEAEGGVVKNTFLGIGLMHKLGGTKLVIIASIIVVIILWVIFR